MAYKLTFNHPNFEKGVEFEISGIGLVKNGGTVSLDAEQERNFQLVTGKAVKDALKSNEMVKLEGSSELKGGE